MKTRTVRFLCVASLACLIPGCGPTKTGIENREAAYARIDAINAHLAYDQARRAFEARQFDKALRAISPAVQRVPDNPDYLLLLGRIHLEEARLEEAMRTFDAAIEAAPEFAPAHYYSGIVQQRWSNDAGAYEAYERARELDSTNVHYLLASAELLVALGRLDDARAAVEPRLDYFEHNAALRHLLGQIALIEGDARRAAQLYREARMLRPDDPQLLEELAHCQFSAGLYGQCYESVRQLRMQVDEDRPELIHLEARTLALMERTIEARDLYLELTHSSATDPDVWIELGTLCWELGDWRRLGESATRTISLAPQRYEGYMLRGIHERHFERWDEAAQMLRQAADRCDSSATPLVLLGLTLEAAGDVAGAQEAYRRALAIEPGSQQARQLLGQITESTRYFGHAGTDEGTH